MGKQDSQTHRRGRMGYISSPILQFLSTMLKLAMGAE